MRRGRQNMLTTHKGNLKIFNRWKKKFLKDIKKECKKCIHKPTLCNHCYNAYVTVINKKIDELGVGESIKKLDYKIM